MLSLLRDRHRSVPMRTMPKNGLQAMALNHRLRLGPRLFTTRGFEQFAGLPRTGAYATAPCLIPTEVLFYLDSRMLRRLESAPTRLRSGVAGA